MGTRCDNSPVVQLYCSYVLQRAVIKCHGIVLTNNLLPGPAVGAFDALNAEFQHEWRRQSRRGQLRSVPWRDSLYQLPVLDAHAVEKVIPWLSVYVYYDCGRTLLSTIHNNLYFPTHTLTSRGVEGGMGCVLHTTPHTRASSTPHTR